MIWDFLIFYASMGIVGVAVEFVILEQRNHCQSCAFLFWFVIIFFLLPGFFIKNISIDSTKQYWWKKP